MKTTRTSGAAGKRIALGTVIVAALSLVATAHSGAESLNGETYQGYSERDVEPATAAAMPERTTREEVEEVRIEPGEVAAVAEYFGIDEDEARQRLYAEVAAIGLDRRLKERWPQDYAGFWYSDDRPTRIVVGIVGELETVQERRETIAEEYAYPDHVDFQGGMALSLAALEEAYWELAADMASLPKHGQHPQRAMRDSQGRLGVGLNVRMNGLDVAIPRSTDVSMRQRDPGPPAHRLREAIIEHYSVPNVTVSVADARDSAQRENHQWDMVGGLRLRWGEVAYCTSGFPAVRGSKTFVMSAAHCAGSWRRNGPNGHYGRVYDQQNGWEVDVEVIRHEAHPWRTGGFVGLFEPAETYRTISSYVGVNEYFTSGFVGFSGATSDVRRGRNVNVSWSGWQQDLQGNWYYYWDLVLADRDLCSELGDSGAPVFRNNDALGILKAKFVDQYGNCIGSLYSKIAHALNRLDVSLLVGWR